MFSSIRTVQLLRPSSRRFFSSKDLLKEATGVHKNIHHSNAEELISKVPVIKVKREYAICDGGGGVLGHPIQYLQLNTSQDAKPVTCLYCGLRFVKDEHHH